MSSTTLYKTVNSNGEYSCGDIGISTEEWYDLLQDSKAQPYIDALLCFLREPDHKGTCSQVSQKYGKTANHFNSKIWHFSQWVQKKLDRFRIQGTDGKDTYWCIAMQKGWETRQGFQWQLRDELAAALQAYLMRELINHYISIEPFNGYCEEYKWDLLDKTEKKDTLTIIKSIRGKNIIDNARVDQVLKTLWETKEQELVSCVNHLFDETKALDERLATFKVEMRTICPADWRNCANDERTAAALLTCRYPEKYTFYKDGVYQLICQYLGIESRKAGKKLSHFTDIINRLAAKYGKEVQQYMLPQIGGFNNKPLNLAVQTLFWCSWDYIKTAMMRKITNYWLTGYTYQEDGSQLDRFISEGIWESLHNDDNPSDQKLLPLARNISVGDVIILKSTSTKGTKHDQPFLRIKAIGIVSSDVTTARIDGATKCQCHIKYVNTDEKDFDGAIYGSYRKSIHLADSKVSDIIDYVDSIIHCTSMPQQKYKEYIDLLQGTHNLVLTGAPGTGKTYMAQAIADEMGAVTKFVQFHPSYDYTDFVEGLRPVEKTDGQIGFERKDGVFKNFCREAIKNLADSQKSIESLSKEMSWQEKLENFIDDSIESGKTFKTVNGSEFIITEIKNRTIVVHNERNEKTTQVAVNAEEILELLTEEVTLNIVRDIRNYFNRRFGTQADSYAFAITKEVQATKRETPIVEANKIERKPYVFIIDEINRGEVSKVFGELFYAIDPGYRGKKEHLVQTQYQNLVPETDVFAKGFYVPENIYILATMNDIDRSVESMDFAMRRRFTWKEVTPADTEGILDALSCADEAKKTMRRINAAIADTDGLGAAYMIGPAYFLKLRENGNDFLKLWNMNIMPLLKEYLRGFRKNSEILETLRKAYFTTQETNIENTQEIVDED